MDKEEFLTNQIDYVQARIEEIDRDIINTSPDAKGSKELIDSYNKWVDRYGELTDRLEHIDDIDIDQAKLALEEKRMEIEEEIERDKINLETEKLRFDREKFAYEIEHQKDRELIDDIFEAFGIAGKFAVPIASVTAVIYVANLAYMNDSKMELCNGRIIGGVKDLIKIMALKL